MVGCAGTMAPAKDLRRRHLADGSDQVPVSVGEIHFYGDRRQGPRVWVLVVDRDRCDRARCRSAHRRSSLARDRTLRRAHRRDLDVGKA